VKISLSKGEKAGITITEEEIEDSSSRWVVSGSGLQKGR
jgi:hypothetical protein